MILLFDLSETLICYLSVIWFLLFGITFSYVSVWYEQELNCSLLLWMSLDWVAVVCICADHAFFDMWCEEEMGSIYEGHLTSFGSDMVYGVLINEMVLSLLSSLCVVNLTSWYDLFTWTRIIS